MFNGRAPSEKQNSGRSGMNYWVTAFFLVAQMAGAGFLALPKAFANCGKYIEVYKNKIQICSNIGQPSDL